MIQTIFLSTAIAFSIGGNGCEGESPLDCPDFTAVKCQAYQEVQGWEWIYINKFQGGAPCVMPGEMRGGILCSREQKILWRKLIGICDDGTVRWVEIK